MKTDLTHSDLHVATPCPKVWDELAGGESKRFCDQCQKHVHNLSFVTERESSRLADEVTKGSRVCVAYFQNEDGSIWRQKNTCSRWFRRWRASLAFLVPFGWNSAMAEPPTGKTGDEEHRNAGLGKDGEIVMGRVAAPTPSPTPKFIFGEAISGAVAPASTPPPPKK